VSAPSKERGRSCICVRCIDFVSFRDFYIFQKLPQADFVMVPDAGHSFQDGGNQSALIAATEKYKHL
jgi:hypothetical protein